MAAPHGYSTVPLTPSAGGVIRAMHGGGDGGAPLGYSGISIIEDVNPSSAPIIPTSGGGGGGEGDPTSADIAAAAAATTEVNRAPALVAVAAVSTHEAINAAREATTKATTIGTTEATTETTSRVTTLSSELEPSSKQITLNGHTITLTKPFDLNEGSKEYEALAWFGVDKAADEGLKKEVLQALYDGVCDTDKPLIMVLECEPIRRLVQSLAEKLLSNLTQPVVKKTAVNAAAKELQSATLMSFNVFKNQCKTKTAKEYIENSKADIVCTQKDTKTEFTNYTEIKACGTDDDTVRVYLKKGIPSAKGIECIVEGTNSAVLFTYQDVIIANMGSNDHALLEAVLKKNPHIIVGSVDSAPTGYALADPIKADQITTDAIWYKADPDVFTLKDAIIPNIMVTGDQYTAPYTCSYSDHNPITAVIEFTNTLLKSAKRSNQAAKETAAAAAGATGVGSLAVEAISASDSSEESGSPPTKRVLAVGESGDALAGASEEGASADAAGASAMDSASTTGILGAAALAGASGEGDAAGAAGSEEAGAAGAAAGVAASAAADAADIAAGAASSTSTSALTAAGKSEVASGPSVRDSLLTDTSVATNLSTGSASASGEGTAASAAGLEKASAETVALATEVASAIAEDSAASAEAVAEAVAEASATDAVEAALTAAKEASAKITVSFDVKPYVEQFVAAYQKNFDTASENANDVVFAAMLHRILVRINNRQRSVGTTDEYSKLYKTDTKIYTGPIQQNATNGADLDLEVLRVIIRHSRFNEEDITRLLGELDTMYLRTTKELKVINLEKLIWFVDGQIKIINKRIAKRIDQEPITQFDDSIDWYQQFVITFNSHTGEKDKIIEKLMRELEIKTAEYAVTYHRNHKINNDANDLLVKTFRDNKLSELLLQIKDAMLATEKGYQVAKKTAYDRLTEYNNALAAIDVTAAALAAADGNTAAASAAEAAKDRLTDATKRKDEADRELAAAEKTYQETRSSITDKVDKAFQTAIEKEGSIKNAVASIKGLSEKVDDEFKDVMDIEGHSVAKMDLFTKFWKELKVLPGIREKQLRTHIEIQHHNDEVSAGRRAEIIGRIEARTAFHKLAHDQTIALFHTNIACVTSGDHYELFQHLVNEFGTYLTTKGLFTYETKPFIRTNCDLMHAEDPHSQNAAPPIITKYIEEPFPVNDEMLKMIAVAAVAVLLQDFEDERSRTITTLDISSFERARDNAIRADRAADAEVKRTTALVKRSKIFADGAAAAVNGIFWWGKDNAQSEAERLAAVLVNATDEMNRAIAKKAETAEAVEVAQAALEKAEAERVAAYEEAKAAKEAATRPKIGNGVAATVVVDKAEANAVAGKAETNAEAAKAEAAKAEAERAAKAAAEREKARDNAIEANKAAEAEVKRTTDIFIYARKLSNKAVDKAKHMTRAVNDTKRAAVANPNAKIAKKLSEFKSEAIAASAEAERLAADLFKARDEMERAIAKKAETAKAVEVAQVAFQEAIAAKVAATRPNIGNGVAATVVDKAAAGKAKTNAAAKAEAERVAAEKIEAERAAKASAKAAAQKAADNAEAKRPAARIAQDSAIRYLPTLNELPQRNLNKTYVSHNGTDEENRFSTIIGNMTSAQRNAMRLDQKIMRAHKLLDSIDKIGFYVYDNVIGNRKLQTYQDELETFSNNIGRTLLEYVNADLSNDHLVVRNGISSRLGKLMDTINTRIAEIENELKPTLTPNPLYVPPPSSAPRPAIARPIAAVAPLAVAKPVGPPKKKSNAVNQLASTLASRRLESAKISQQKQQSDYQGVPQSRTDKETLRLEIGTLKELIHYKKSYIDYEFTHMNDTKTANTTPLKKAINQHMDTIDIKIDAIDDLMEFTTKQNQRIISIKNFIAECESLLNEVDALMAKIKSSIGISGGKRRTQKKRKQKKRFGSQKKRV